MKEKLDEEEIKELIKKAKTERDFKKIKNLAMHSSIKLGDLRKKFCKNCFHPLKGVTRINKGVKSIKCENCGKISRWKIKKK